MALSMGLLGGSAFALFGGYYTRTTQGGIFTDTWYSFAGADQSLYLTIYSGDYVTILKHDAEGNIVWYSSGLGITAGQYVNTGYATETPNGFIFRPSYENASGSWVLHQFNATTGAGLRRYNNTQSDWNARRVNIAVRSSDLVMWLVDRIVPLTDANPTVFGLARGFGGVRFRWVETDSTNSSIGAGQNSTFARPWFVRLDSSLNIIYQREITAPSFDTTGPEEYEEVGTDSSNNIYLKTVLRHGVLWVVKYSSGGTLLWQKKIAPPSGRTFSTNFMKVAPNGDVYVTSKTGTIWWWMKFDTNGNVAWQREMACDITIRHASVDPVNGDLFIGGGGNVAMRYPSSGDAVDITIDATFINGPIQTAAAIITEGGLSEAASSRSTFTNGTFQNNTSNTTFTTTQSVPTQELVQF